MKCRSILMMAVVLFAGTCAAGEPVSVKNSFKVAAILDLSGHYSQFGEEVRTGMDLFIESNRGAEFEIEYHDSEGSAERALSIFNQATTDTHVKAVVTLASWISNAVAPEAKKKNVLHYAVGSAVFAYPANENTVRFTSDVIDESVYMINYLKDYNSVGLMYFDNDYGRGWESRLANALGAKLKITRSYSDTDTDFRSILTDIKNASPEIVVLISTREAVEITRQVKQLGIRAKLVGTRPILTDALLQEPDAEGLVFTYPDLDEDSVAYKKYVEKYNKKPSAFVAEGFDLAATLNAASLKGPFDRRAVYESYLAKSFSGLFSRIEFNNTAQASSKYNLMIIKDGKYQNFK